MSSAIPVQESDIILTTDGQGVRLQASDVWVEVGNLWVHVIKTDEGAIADIWSGEEALADGPITSAYAYFNEAREDAP